MRAASSIVVVTGLGMVTALGHTADETFENLCLGKSGIEVIPELKEAGFPVRIGARVRDLDKLLTLYPEAATHGSRKLAYVLKSMDEAMFQAGISSYDGKRAGVFLGVETSRAPFAESYEIFSLSGREKGRVDYSIFARECREIISPERIQNKFPFFLPALLASRHGIAGPVMATSNACASSNYAMGEALRHLRDGAIDMAVVGSADEMIDEYMITGFSLLRALSQNNQDPAGSSRPFDSKRDGFVLGEGGAVLIIETLEHALSRGARPLCEIAGYGATSDAEKITACNRQGTWLGRAMDSAIEDAGLVPSDIGYVNAHGTSTRLNDQAEAAAISRVFMNNPEAPLVNSTKSMLGHTVAAAGAIEAVVTVMSLFSGRFHPCLNLEQPDPGSQLNFCTSLVEKSGIRAAISNSCGFSGGNSCIVFRLSDDQ